MAKSQTYSHVNCGSVLAGAFVAANSNGIVFPSFVREEELSAIKAIFKGNVKSWKPEKQPLAISFLAND